MEQMVRINKQTFLNGIIYGAGVHSLDKFSESAINSIKEYQQEQLALPVDERDNPLFYQIVGDVNEEAVIEETDNSIMEYYASLTNKELKEECRKKGIEFKNNAKNAELIELLVESDEQDDEGLFWDAESFSSASDEDKIDYLESIAEIPDDYDEEAYGKCVIDALHSYGALSLNKDVVEKIKEVLEYFK